MVLATQALVWRGNEMARHVRGITVSVREHQWPTEEAPRCARCGQPHVPVAGPGRFLCGNCGRILVSRVPQTKAVSEPRWTYQLLALAVAVGLIALLLRAAPIRGKEQKEPRTPASLLPSSASAESPSTGFWVPEVRNEERLTPAELDERIRQLRVASGEEDTYLRNMELGDLLLLRGIRAGLQAEGLPPNPPPGMPGLENWTNVMRWRLSVVRFMKGVPQARQSLRQAAQAYQRAVSLANSQERRGRAHRNLGYALFALGDFQGAMRQAERVAAIFGTDDVRLRMRCLFALGQEEEAASMYLRVVGAFVPVR